MSDNESPSSEKRSVELDALRATLDGLRRTVLNIVTAFSEIQLHTAALPSGWTPLELVRHLTLGDERYWFTSILGGGDLDWIPQGPRADWLLGPDDTATSIIDDYRNQIEASNAALDGLNPDDPPRRKDPMWGEWGIDFPTVRVILHHVIVEAATHVGHLDAAAELLDGRQRIVMN